MAAPVPTFRAVARPLGPDPAYLARIAAFAALAIVGRVAFVWAPNYALTYFVVFLAGVLDGKRAGAAVGLIAMTATNLLFSGLHPVLVANGLAMALLGVLGGAVAPLVRHVAADRLDKALQVMLLVTCGLFGTLLFSVATDLLSYVMMFVLTPEGQAIGARALVPLLVMGLVFNLGPALMNALLFAGVTPALLAVLQRAGHVRARVPPAKAAKAEGK